MRSQAVTVLLTDESSEVHTPLIALSPEPSVDIREWACVGPRGKLEKSEPCACASSRVNLYPYQKTRVARAKIDLSMGDQPGDHGSGSPPVAPLPAVSAEVPESKAQALGAEPS